MRLNTFLLGTFCFATVAISRPSDGGKGDEVCCLTDHDTYEIIHTFFSFFEAGFDPAVAEATLADDFFEQSGGFNFLTAQPVGLDSIASDDAEDFFSTV